MLEFLLLVNKFSFIFPCKKYRFIIKHLENTDKQIQKYFLSLFTQASVLSHFGVFCFDLFTLFTIPPPLWWYVLFVNVYIHICAIHKCISLNGICLLWVIMIHIYIHPREVEKYWKLERSYEKTFFNPLTQK